MQIKDVVAGRKYTTKEGEEKTKWVTVGKLLIKDDGHFSLKLEDYINPSAFKNEKGEVWLNVFDQRSENATKTSEKKGAYTEPTQSEKERIMADGRAYSDKWRKKAQGDFVDGEIADDGTIITDEGLF